MSFAFTGKEDDLEAGIQYFGKRFFLPALGRWLTPDPLAVHAPGKGDPNLYAYVHGQLLRGVDPDGLDCGVNESCNHPMASDGAIPAQPDLSGPKVRAATEELMTRARGAPFPVSAPAEPAYTVRDPLADAGAEAGRIADGDPNPVAKVAGRTAQAGAFAGSMVTGTVAGIANAPGKLHAAAKNIARGEQHTIAEGLVQATGAAIAIAPLLSRIRAGTGVRMFAPDALNRPTGATKLLTPNNIDGGSDALRSIIPPGLAQGDNRAHLIASMLGGSGKDPLNLVAFNWKANQVVMRGFEFEVRAAVRAGEAVRYTAVPIYAGSALRPSAITLTAEGNFGFSLGVSVLNIP